MFDRVFNTPLVLKKYSLQVFFELLLLQYLHLKFFFARLELVLIKKEPGIFWTTLVPGDVYGDHEIDGEEAVKMEEVHQSLAHLTSSNDNDMEVGP